MSSGARRGGGRDGALEASDPHIRARGKRPIGIWEYSFEQWGAGQADNYLDELNTGIQLLADHPELGANRDYVREGYRVLFVNRHAIYYIVSPSGIRVVRVLHEEMDPGKHF